MIFIDYWLKGDRRMTLIKVINHLRKEYKKAKKLNFVYRPMSYAMYQTWRWCDLKEKEQTNENNV